MLITNYDRITGESLGVTEARESPRESGVFLTPAFSTPEEAPAASAGCVSVFLGPDGIPPADYQLGEWTEKIDRRGMYWDKATASPVALTTLGVQPEEQGMTDKEPTGMVVWGGSDWVVDTAKITSDVLARRAFLMNNATTKIAPLADAVELGIATAAETALLTEWKKYRVALSRIEQQAVFPLGVQWPDAPDAVSQS